MLIIRNTVNDLIIRAFALVNEIAPNEYPEDFEIAEGLIYLNELLDNISSEGMYIPYNNDVIFNTVGGQATYTFGKTGTTNVDTNKIIEITDAYVKYFGINYPLTEIQHDEAFQIVRYPSAQTRPTQIFLQNYNEISEITLFYTPDSNYEIVLRVKQVLDHVELQQQLNNLPPYYRRFLRYALARELASVFETNSWNELKENEYQRMLEGIKGASDTDWSLNVSTVLRRRYIGLTKGNILVG